MQLGQLLNYKQKSPSFHTGYVINVSEALAELQRFAAKEALATLEALCLSYHAQRLADELLPHIARAEAAFAEAEEANAEAREAAQAAHAAYEKAPRNAEAAPREAYNRAHERARKANDAQWAARNELVSLKSLHSELLKNVRKIGMPAWLRPVE